MDAVPLRDLALLGFPLSRAHLLHLLPARPGAIMSRKKEISKTIRLTYNCAYLRSTKETLTIEYFRIILEKKLGENFLG